MKKTVRAQNVEQFSSFIDLKFLEKDMAKEHLREFLISSLLIYILARSKEPISAVLDDLLKIEIEAGRILGKILRRHKTPVELKGYLAGVLSFIEFPQKTSRKERVASKKPGSKAK